MYINDKQLTLLKGALILA